MQTWKSKIYSRGRNLDMDRFGIYHAEQIKFGVYCSQFAQMFAYVFVVRTYWVPPWWCSVLGHEFIATVLNSETSRLASRKPVQLFWQVESVVTWTLLLNTPAMRPRSDLGLHSWLLHGFTIPFHTWLPSTGALISTGCLVQRGHLKGPPQKHQPLNCLKLYPDKGRWGWWFQFPKSLLFVSCFWLFGCFQK